MSRLHELLPWYVNGTLEAPERAEFESHLNACAECRDEMSIIEKLHADLRESSTGAFTEHPSPPALMEAIQPGTGDEPLEPEAASDIRRHLALCLTCSEEARWLRGEAVARTRTAAAIEDLSRQRPVSGWMGWAALAAAGIVLVVAIGIIVRSDRPALPTGVLNIDLVPSAERFSTGRQEIEVTSDATVSYLLFEVDLAPEEYPASFRILDSGDSTVFDLPDLEASDLYRSTGLLFACSREDCPDGDYTARLSPKGGLRPDIEYPFRLTTAP